MYIQAKGLPIGNRLSGLLADVFVSQIQSSVMSNFVNIPCFRYVDDFLVITNNEQSATQILNAYNSNGGGLKFEMEKPDAHGSIPYLDFSLNVTNGNPVISFYQKPCKKPLFIHADSAVPKSSFLSMIRNERQRIIHRCTKTDARLKCLNSFNIMLKQRGHQIPNRNLTTKTQITDKSSPKFFLNIPFVNDGIDKMVKKSLEPLGVKIIISHKLTRLRNLLKPRKVGTQRNGSCQICGLRSMDCTATHVVYKMTCKKCNEFYIGSTWRRLHLRIREHKSIKSSLVYQHKCKGEWHTEVLYRTNHVQKMRLMEALIIKDLKPGVNGKETIFDKHVVI
jgi:hypothetical protein